MKTLRDHRHLRDQLTLGLTLGAIAFIIISLGLFIDKIATAFSATPPNSPPPVHQNP